MERYFYETGEMACGETEVTHNTDIVDEDGECLDSDCTSESVSLYADGFMVFDRLRGHVDHKALAYCADSGDAQKIVDALNRLPS